MLKLESDKGVIGLGIASLLLITCYAFTPPFRFWGDGLTFLSELICASVLCLGVVKQNPFYLLPWLLLNAYFTCNILYAVLLVYVFFTNPQAKDADWTFFILLPMLIFAIPTVSLYSVCQAFCRMRKDRAQPTSTCAA